MSDFLKRATIVVALGLLTGIGAGILARPSIGNPLRGESEIWDQRSIPALSALPGLAPSSDPALIEGNSLNEVLRRAVEIVENEADPQAVFEGNPVWSLPLESVVVEFVLWEAQGSENPFAPDPIAMDPVDDSLDGLIRAIVAILENFRHDGVALAIAKDAIDLIPPELSGDAYRAMVSHLPQFSNGPIMMSLLRKWATHDFATAAEHVFADESASLSSMKALMEGGAKTHFRECMEFAKAQDPHITRPVLISRVVANIPPTLDREAYEEIANKYLAGSSDERLPGALHLQAVRGYFKNVALKDAEFAEQLIDKLGDRRSETFAKIMIRQQTKQ